MENAHRTMATLTLFLLSSLAFGQQTTTRLDVVYDGATPGKIRGYEQGVPKGNYIDLIWPSSLAANYTLTMPKSTTTLLGQINYHYHDSQALPVSIWRAHGTEASPTNLTSGDSIFSFVGIGRVGGTWISLGSFGVNYANIAGVDVGSITFSTRNSGVVSDRVSIDHLGRIVPFASGQDLGTTGTGYWNSLYINGGTPIYFERSARTSAQRMLWTVGGSSSTDGVWQLGVGPISSQSELEFIHNGTLRMRMTEASGIYAVDNFFPQTTDTYSLGSATYQWNNLYVKYIDVEGDIQPKTNNTVPLGSSSLRFSKLWVTDIDCSGTCGGSVSPPVDWHLDNTNHVLTMGTHGASGAFQALMQHSRGTHASPTDTVDNDRIGQIAFQLYGGGGYRDAAAIRVEADGTPSGTSSPARIGFFVTPAASTTPVERLFLQQDGEFWIRSSMTSDRGLYIQNDSSSGYSSIAFVDNGGTLKGYTGWNNGSAAVNPGVFTVGTRTNDLLTFLQNDTIRWYVSSSGLYPNSDGAYVIGSSSLKPSSITSRSFFTETPSGYGTQQNTFSADSNLNLYLVAASSAAATDRASLQFYRYRNTVASPTSVSNGDRLGNIAWAGYASGANAVGGVIEAYVNGTVSGGVLPTELRFRTMNAAGTLADRAVLSSNGWVVTGSVEPNASATWSLGASGKEWTNGFFINLTVSNGSGQGVQGNLVPNTNNAYTLGGSSYQWSTVHARNFDSYNEFALIASSITRFLVSASSIATFDSGGSTTSTLVTADGRFSSGNHWPLTNNSYDLGSSSLNWRDVYVSRDILIGASGGLQAPDGNYGLSYVATVRNSAGTGTCTITFSAGIATTTTC